MSLPDILAKVTTTLAAICIALFTGLRALDVSFEESVIKIKVMTRRGFHAGTFFLISSLLLIFQLLISSWGIEVIKLCDEIIIPISFLLKHDYLFIIK